MKSRQEAWSLLSEHTKTASLLKHSLAVEAAMRWHARAAGLSHDEIELWGNTGLLHDFDYEQHQTSEPPDGHPYYGNRILTELGWPEELRTAIMGHALYTNTPRLSAMAKTLFAVDELSGLVTATVLVRPDRSIHMLEAKSVVKRMKDKAFARGCNRDDIRLGAAELGIELELLVENTIKALREVAPELELNGITAPQAVSG